MSMPHYHISQYVLDNVDPAEAKRVYKETRFPAKPNELAPWEGENPPVGTWRLDPVFGEFEILLELSLDEITPGEPEDGIKNWEGYPLYVQWAREGREAPAITVVRHVNGHLVSCDRRRVLAAKDAGKKTILAWFSETDNRGRNPWQDRGQGSYWHTRVKQLSKMASDGYEVTDPDDLKLIRELA